MKYKFHIISGVPSLQTSKLTRNGETVSSVSMAHRNEKQLAQDLLSFIDVGK